MEQGVSAVKPSQAEQYETLRQQAALAVKEGDYLRAVQLLKEQDKLLLGGEATECEPLQSKES